MVSFKSTLLRAINLPATEDHAADQQWFFDEDLMNQYLLITGRGYISEDGHIKDRDGEQIGNWFYVEITKDRDPIGRPKE